MEIGHQSPYFPVQMEIFQTEVQIVWQKKTKFVLEILYVLCQKSVSGISGRQKYNFLHSL